MPVIPTIDTSAMSPVAIQARTLPLDRWTVIVGNRIAAYRYDAISELTRIKALRKFRDINFTVGIIQNTTEYRNRAGIAAYTVDPVANEIRGMPLTCVAIDGIGFKPHLGQSITELRFTEPFILQERQFPEEVVYPTWVGGSTSVHASQTYEQNYARYRAYNRQIRDLKKFYDRQVNTCLAAFDRYLERCVEQGQIRVLQFRDLNAAGPATT